MTQQFTDLNYRKLPDGMIRLEQTGYAGEKATIDVHPLQIEFIARQLAGLKPETAGKVADLERKMAVLTDKLEVVICDKQFRVSLIQDDDGFAYLAKLDGLLDLALEFDGGRLIAETARCEPESNETSEGTGKSEKMPPASITHASSQLF